MDKLLVYASWINWILCVMDKLMASYPDSERASQPAREPGNQHASEPSSQPASCLPASQASQPASSQLGSQAARQLANQPANQPSHQPASCWFPCAGNVHMKFEKYVPHQIFLHLGYLKNSTFPRPWKSGLFEKYIFPRFWPRVEKCIFLRGRISTGVEKWNFGGLGSKRFAGSLALGTCMLSSKSTFLTKFSCT